VSSVVRIPRELQEFLELAGPQTLLVRGPPGSGKTTLSLALLEAFQGEKFLVTSRVPDQELGREFPWLGENGSAKIRIIDTSGENGSVHDVARSVRLMREYLVRPSQPDDKDAARFMWLPEPLQETWAQLSAERPALVIIDSWDALVEGFLGGIPAPDEPVPERAEIERLLIRRISKIPVHMVFVLERAEQTSLDYLVNAVVVTGKETSHEHLARWVRLEKIRGVRIENPNYPFSLEGSKFEAILPVQPYQKLRPGIADAEADPMPGHIWPGSRDFAASFGRLPIGRITLVEVDADASPQVPNLLILPMVTSVLDRGGRVLMVPHSSESPADIWADLTPSVSKARFLSQVRLVVPQGPIPKGREEIWRSVLPFERPDPKAPPPPIEESPALRFLMEGASDRSPGLIIISLQGLEGIASSMGTPLSPEIQARIPEAFHHATRAAFCHMVLVGRSGSALLEHVRPIATIRLIINLSQGRIFIRGVNPWTPNFVLTEGSTDQAYRLLRIV
jgi:hypothetical protein